MKNLVYILMLVAMGSVAFAQTQSVPAFKFSMTLLNAPITVPNPPYSDVTYQTVDTTLTTVTITVQYADDNTVIWSSGALTSAQVNFNKGTLNYNIGPVHGNLLRDMKIVVDADGVITERPWGQVVTTSQFRTPIGVVQSYMGNGSYLAYLESVGWYLCDGRTIASLTGLSADEKAALISLLHSGGNPDSTRLPDMRGYFLRGADQGSGNDPDFAARSGSGAKLGSSQTAQVQAHTHTLAADPSIGAGTSVATSAGNTTTVTTSSTGGSETRPKNIYVNWIIRAK